MFYMIELSFNVFDSDLVEIKSSKHKIILPLSLSWKLAWGLQSATEETVFQSRSHPTSNDVIISSYVSHVLFTYLLKLYSSTYSEADRTRKVMYIHLLVYLMAFLVSLLYSDSIWLSFSSHLISILSITIICSY